MATNVVVVFLVVLGFLDVIKVPKTVSLLDRSLSNLAHRLVTIFPTIIPCEIFKLSRN